MRAGIGLLGVAVIASIAVARRHDLGASFGLLGHLRWVWIPLALGLEWCSMSVFGRMQLRFLEAGGVRLRTGAMLATVYSANALSVSIPLAGPGLGASFTFRRFKQQGVDPPLAGWSLTVGGIISVVAGIVVLMAGALLSGNDLLAVAGVGAGLLGAATLGLLHVAGRHPRVRRAIESAAAWALARARRLLRRPGQDPAEAIHGWAERLVSLRPKRSVWIGASSLALVNWLADAGVLAASIYAVGAPVPWQALLLVYGSGAVIGSLGITPGGLGLVEGTLCVGLVGAGLHAGQALASVLLYRLISFWLVTAGGWIVLLCLRLGRRNIGGRTRVPSPLTV